MRVALLSLALSLTALSYRALAQDAAAPSSAGKPTEHVLGTVSAVDAAASTVTVKEDATAKIRIIDLTNTRTLLKVAPGAKDVKDAVRITPADLAIGDRVDVRGFPSTSSPDAVAARSIILMSNRDLEDAHRAESDQWRRATSGVVTAVDPAASKVTINARGPGGPHLLVVDASSAQLLRYVPEQPEAPRPAPLTAIQLGDQVRVLGGKNAAGDGLTATKIYSGTFKTVAGTIVKVSPDGLSLVVKDLSSKTNVAFSVSSSTPVHKLPPPMAYMLARRLNPAAASAPGSANGGGSSARSENTAPQPAQPPAAPPERSARPGESESGSPMRPRGPGNGEFSRGDASRGDLSQMLNRLPKISLADLKPGDAVIVSGSPVTNSSTVIATAVIAGVEPIFQSATPREAQSLGDWNGAFGAAPNEGAAAGPQ